VRQSGQTCVDVSAMKYLFFLVTGSLPYLVGAVPWNGPQPTNINDANRAVGFSPKPTDRAIAGRLESNLLKRQDGGYCGIWNGERTSSRLELY
jgi:hypothetical protein